MNIVGTSEIKMILIFYSVKLQLLNNKCDYSQTRLYNEFLLLTSKILLHCFLILHVATTFFTAIIINNNEHILFVSDM
jgi:hypothetical protein